MCGCASVFVCDIMVCEVDCVVVCGWCAGLSVVCVSMWECPRVLLVLCVCVGVVGGLVGGLVGCVCVFVLCVILCTVGCELLLLLWVLLCVCVFVCLCGCLFGCLVGLLVDWSMLVVG